MDIAFMNSENSQSSEPHILLHNLADELNLKRSGKYVAWSYKNSKFKMSAPTWNEYFDLPDGLYTVSDIRGYVE